MHVGGTSSRPKTRKQWEEFWPDFHKEYKRQKKVTNVVDSESIKQEIVTLDEISGGFEKIKKDESSVTRGGRGAGNGGEECSGSGGVEIQEHNSNVGDDNIAVKISGQESFSKGFSLKNRLGLRSGGPVLQVEVGSRDENANPENDDSVDVVLSISYSDNSGGDSDGSENSKDEQFSSENSDVPIGVSDKYDECDSDEDIRTNGEEENNENHTIRGKIEENDSNLGSRINKKFDSTSGLGSNMGVIDRNLNLKYDDSVVLGSSSDSEDSGGDSDESEESLDSDEVESSSEEDNDDSDGDYKGEEAFHSDDSDVRYISSDTDVEYDSDRNRTGDVRTDEEEENKESDEIDGKTLRSGKKITKVSRKRIFDSELQRDDESDEGYNENKGDSEQEKGRFGDFTGGNVSKEVNHYSNKSCLKKRKLPGLEIFVEFGETSVREQKSFGNRLRPKSASKSREKGPQLGKIALPPPVIDSDDTDDESVPSRIESASQKEWKSKEELMFPKKMNRAGRNAELIRILVNSIDGEGPRVEGRSKIQEPLPVKFRFEDEVEPLPEKSEWEKEIDSLFLDFELCLRASEIDDSASASKADLQMENHDIVSTEIDEGPEASCRRGVHQPILDEQIGMICRSCGAIILEMKDILPPWYSPPSRRKDRKDFGESESPTSVIGELRFQNSGYEPCKSFNRGKGTVWDLIPGHEKDMFPHQCEGLEFLWKNIAGDIRIEKLPKTLSNEDGRGCIISHAPGTGKTRLTIVFLLSFLKHYPNAHPVILAPRGMLLTWEDEFTKWKVDIPFHNLNKSELSANELRTASDKAGWPVGVGGMSKQDVRLVKLCSWILSGGILGMSYQLFASFYKQNRKIKGDEREQVIWDTLVQKPGLLVLDEGHMPRNGKSNIWKALRKVNTKRRVILSGTPFQNNFKELRHTLCLVDPRFFKIDKSSWKELTEGTDELENLRSMLDPYVHLYKGTILQQSLPGLRDTIVFLRPTALQKTLLDVAVKEKEFWTRTRLVSLISVHPSIALSVAKGTKLDKNPTFQLHKNKLEEIEFLDEGVKIKFVMNLIRLATALGERVLIFSQYIPPLDFIKQQLKAQLSWHDGREVLYMDGQLEEKQRQESICTLNNNLSEAKVLLASVKACSEGINLVGASRVVLIDTVWNPSVERQAISRAYRLGQKKVVYVYRLIISGMDIRQYELQVQKDRIAKLIFSPVEGQDSEVETSRAVSEDKVLEQMHNLESCSHIFEKIVHQPKESDLIETFQFMDLR